jgi:hypothetical protein
MNTKSTSSVVQTVEICPNCKSQMTVALVTPVLLADHFETVTYWCKACRSELKLNFERRSGVWQAVHLDRDTQYRIAFFKHLLSSDGHPFKCLQQRIEIRSAKNIERALKAAEHRYERLCHVRDWRLHADMFELEACSPA